VKSLSFRKVKIVRRNDEVEYSENLYAGWTKNRDSNNLWCFEKKRLDWNKSDKRKYVEKYSRCAEKYRRSLKKPGKKLNLETCRWFVVDESTGETIKAFDSIEQAKRFCIKNDYDFGLY